MVLGKLPVLGILLIRITERQGPTVLAVGTSGIVWAFLFLPVIFLFFLPLSGDDLI